ncbi:uncharacterized protein LOC144162063 [Haemaphysalis longicornis]
MGSAAKTSPAFLLLLVAACATGQKELSMEACQGSDVGAFVMVSWTLKQIPTTDLVTTTSTTCQFANTPCELTKGETFQGSFQLIPLLIRDRGEASFQLEVNNHQNPMICGHTKLQVVGGTTQAVNTTEASTDNSRSDH